MSEVVRMYGLLPEASSNDGYVGDYGSVPKLNAEQMQDLMKRLSSDEMKQLQETVSSCTSRVMMTRGIPITTLLLGSLYVARQRLPAQYHFGPKGWPFYAIMGLGTLTATNVVFMKQCSDEVKPLIDQFWLKYSSSENASSMTYDQLRQRHRAGMVAAPQEATSSNAWQDPSLQPPPTTSGDGFDMTYRPSRPPAFDYSSYQEGGPAYMSGTPSGNRRPNDGGVEFS